MKIEIDKIYEGWRNNLFPPEKLKKVIGYVSRRRRYICDGGEHNSKFHKTFRPDIHCMLCGCTLSAKTKCLSCECPATPSKWRAVVSEKEEEEMTDEKK